MHKLFYFGKTKFRYGKLSQGKYQIITLCSKRECDIKKAYVWIRFEAHSNKKIAKNQIKFMTLSKLVVLHLT